jgi:pyruvate dehydrogenase E1 component
MPKRADVHEGILKGMYRFKTTGLKGSKAKAAPRAHLLGSGAILNEAIKAGEILEKDYGVAADIWSVTSYKELYRDAVDCERWNLLNPAKKAKTPYLSGLLAKEEGVFVAASDYMKVMPATVAQWIPGPLHCLGTDGFGRSDGRDQLRDFFEVDARYIVLATLRSLADSGDIKPAVVVKAVGDLGIDPGKLNPHTD